jgi:excisionase family DNA binding protein
MNVTLTDYYENLVQKLVEQGRYADQNEVVRAGLRLVEALEPMALWPERSDTSSPRGTARDGSEIPAIASVGAAMQGKSAEPLVCDINEAARLLSVSTKTVRNLLARRRLTNCGALRKVLIPRKQLEQFVNGSVLDIGNWNKRGGAEVAEVGRDCRKEFSSRRRSAFFASPRWFWPPDLTTDYRSQADGGWGKLAAGNDI